MATGVAEPLPPSTPTAPTYSYPPVIIILTIVLLIFFFAGFFSIYFCRCFMQNLLCTWHLRRNTAAAPAGGAAAMPASGAGLDPSIVESFPSFTYSTVKGYTKERYGLECAICLVEFRSSDVLRLLTNCCHVFHQECIDLWLESHRTCPVCRRNLNSPVQSPMKSPRSSTHAAVDEATTVAAVDRESCSITIKDDDDDERKQKEEEDQSRDRERGEEGSSATTTEGDGAQNERDKFSRSHSTGHSMARNRGEERFTLILPEEVKSRIIRGHNSSKSWTNFGEYKTNPKDESCVAEASGMPVGDDKV